MPRTTASRTILPAFSRCCHPPTSGRPNLPSDTAHDPPAMGLPIERTCGKHARAGSPRGGNRCQTLQIEARKSQGSTGKTRHFTPFSASKSFPKVMFQTGFILDGDLGGFLECVDSAHCLFFHRRVPVQADISALMNPCATGQPLEIVAPCSLAAKPAPQSARNPISIRVRGLDDG